MIVIPSEAGTLVSFYRLKSLNCIKLSLIIMKILSIIILYITFQFSLNSQTANVTTHDYQENSASKRYLISVKYPQVDFGPDALMGVRGIAQDINSCIDTLWNNRVKDFKYEVKGLPEKPCTEQPSALNVTYKTVYNDNSLFSFSFETFSAPDCANHPYNYTTTLNYSITSIGAFGLSDIFLQDKPYLKFISDYCMKELKARAIKDKLDNVNNMIEQGTSQKEDNFRVFNVNTKELIITFNPYQVGPWIWGTQSVSIPYNEIKNMIDPSGPLGTFIK
jgi:hypothetical protein